MNSRLTMCTWHAVFSSQPLRAVAFVIKCPCWTPEQNLWREFRFMVCLNICLSFIYLSIYNLLAGLCLSLGCYLLVSSISAGP